jgi:hypothetical protein
MKPKRRKCKFCNDWYEPKFTTTEPCPKYDCKMQHFEANKPKIITKIKQIRNAEAKIKKESLKKLSEYESEAKKEFQHFIRLRDKDLPCISCNTPTCDVWAGGHYYPAGHYSGIIFNEMNCHKQCNTHCNKFLNGNTHEYRRGLMIRYGKAFVEKLDSLAILGRNKKYSKFELIEIKELYKSKIKKLKSLES